MSLAAIHPDIERLQPPARHASDLINLAHGKEELLLGNKLPLMNQPPENPQFFEEEIQAVQGELFGVEALHGAGAEGGIEREVQRVEGVVQQALGEREAVAAGEALRAIERPREQLLDQGQNGRARNGHGGARCYFTLKDVASVENLLAAAHRARRGKSRKPDVEDFFHRIETEVMVLHEALMSGTWRPGGYRQFIIREPKRRLICAAPFADRVVHHALCLRMEPVLSRRFIARSFSCQQGKGTTAARGCVRKLVNRHRYVLKCDVRKFFESIDHGILQDRLSRALPCAGVREVIGLIVDSHATPGRNRPCGLPLGNLTSQLWANFFLDPLDHWITEELRHGAYARYTDDFLIFSDDKAALHALRGRIETHLAAMRLELAATKTRVMATREGVPFCGFRFLPGLRPRVLGATKRRFEKRRAHLFRVKAPLARLSAAVFAWYQFSREGNTEGLRRAYSAWSLAQRHRVKRRRGRTSRVLRGASWNNNDRGNLLSSNRNHNTPANRNNNNGFRVVTGGISAPKTA